MVLGPQHADTLVAKSGLAVTLRVQGKNVEAESLFREIVPGHGEGTWTTAY
jgi:hypothetical protein